MQEAFAADPPRTSGWIPRVISLTRSEAPSLAEWSGSLATAILLVLSFPNFDFPLLAWCGLIPLLIVIARRPSLFRAFVLGWVTGSVFFYSSCYWLTYSMIHYGGLPTWLAYVLLIPGALFVGLFPALFALVLALALIRWGNVSLLMAPFLWATFEWLRLSVTGQLWNAIGYSQAFHPAVIQSAAIGGVYLIGFLILTVNSAIALVVHQRTRNSVIISATILAFVAVVLVLSSFDSLLQLVVPTERGKVNVVAVQPNVPMSPVKTPAETQELIDRHLAISTNGLQQFPDQTQARLVIWPESPMNFTYSADRTLRDLLSKFTKENHTSLLLNSLQPAPNDGGFNSAVLINEEGRQISQYDKIRLMPFGEYVPLPQWLGGSLISGLVGEFTAGDRYTLMPIADSRAGVFICIESAYPWIARNLTNEGADFLINISNDGYLGPTAVMRQHLANAVFRAVENGRPLLRVTNSGITAFISPKGNVRGATPGFVAVGSVWSIDEHVNQRTFFTKHGDLFVEFCGFVTLTILILAFVKGRKSLRTIK
jgi:apolipoprotein N-acyltransferase